MKFGPRGTLLVGLLLSWSVSAAAQQEAAAPASAETASAPPPTPSSEPTPERTTVEAAQQSANDAAGAQSGADPKAGAELSAAELAELGLTQSSDGSTEAEESLNLYGFADFSFGAALVPKNSPYRGVLYRHSAFWIGNFNLYMSREIFHSLRMFGEVRFTFLPNGSGGFDSPTGEYTSTTAEDYNDFRRNLRWGAIEIERVYLEWMAHRFLTVRAGLFLTPYGIWNVDHGSPTIIPVQRPYLIGEELFPERQMGLELFGQAQVTSHDVIGYHATLSNGVGPVSEYRDFDENKAFGARLYWSNDAFGKLRVGGSLFYGTEVDARSIPGIAADGKHATFKEKVVYRAEHLALAADLQWTFKGLLLQSEFVTQQRRVAEKDRIGAANPLLGQYLATNDRLSWGAYGLVGYRLPWFGIMPYLVVQALSGNDPRYGIRVRVNGFAAGLNVRPIPPLVIKLEYSEERFPDGFLVSDKPFRFIQLQLAWAF